MERSILLCILIVAACDEIPADAAAEKRNAEAGTPHPVTATVLATGQAKPWSLAIHDAHVYFTTEGRVRRVAKAGGPVSDVAPRAMERQEPISVDDGFLYFVSDRQIQKVPVVGGATTTLAVSESTVRGVVIVNHRPQWIEWRREDGGVRGSLVLHSVSTSGDAPRVAPLPAPASLLGTAAVDLRSDAVSVYVNVLETRTIYRIQADAIAGEIRVAEPLRALAVDDAEIYFIDTDAIRAVPKHGGDVRDVASRIGFSEGLALDATYVYFTETVTNGRLLRVPKAGGQAAAVAIGQGTPRGIAVDDENVYWSCIEEGTIKKIRK